MSTTDRFVQLYAQLYHHLCRRRDPSEYRPTRESLAVLQHLASTGPLTVQEAAKHFSRSQSAMSELIERMIKRGLLEKMPDERDRRRHLVWLTEGGLSVVKEESQPLDGERLTAALAQLTPKQQRDLIEQLGRLVDASAKLSQTGGTDE